MNKTGQTKKRFNTERMTWKLIMFIMACAICHGKCPDPSKCSAAPNNRFDCAPEKALNKDECEARGCCYVPVDSSESTGQPACFFPSDYPNYKMVNFTKTKMGYSAILIRSQPTFMPYDLMKLQMNVLFETNYRLRITIKDAINQRYEVPLKIPDVTKKADPVQYNVWFKATSFGFSISRKSNGNVLVNTSLAPLIFADQFIQLSTSLSSPFISGLGEHLTPLMQSLNWTKLTFWNRDLIPRENANLYGAHPFYLGFENDGSAHGVFLLNSNAMDVILQPAPALTWKTTGGILDMFFFMGPDPMSVIQQYYELIGFPHMPPYWALGFHLCRWGYNTSAETWKAAQMTREAGIPQDVQWNDIDYMDLNRDFTFDYKRYGDLPALVNNLHEMQMKYVMIMEPAIAITSPPGSYPPYDKGLKNSVFITNATGQPLRGKVWPGETAFVDFTNPNASEWWFDMFKTFHEKVPFDGAWIDMNEPANNVHGSLDGCPDDNLENPPYVPGVVGGRLCDTTICASSHQYLSSHYNLHNMYGYFEAKETSSALEKMLGKRSLVISRSNYPGIGQYAGHWTGDVESTWEQLYYSVPAMIMNNMFGIPLVGTDVCGFVGDAAEELCVRWHQVGSFYPFMRNHNTKDAKPQEPYVFSADGQKAIRYAILKRYLLLPYLYTLFHNCHTSGEVVIRALFMEFPSDQNTWKIDRQFMWGSALLITPVLEQGKTEVNGYFPEGTWYDPANGAAFESKGEWRNLSAPLDIINMHVRAGYIVPGQEPALTTAETRKNQMLLIVPLTKEGNAHGELFWDDGESLNTYEQGEYSHITFSAQNNSLVSEVVKLEEEAEQLVIHLIGIFGCKDIPKEVLVNGVPTLDYQYMQKNQFLRLKNLSLPLGRKFEIKW